MRSHAVSSRASLALLALLPFAVSPPAAAEEAPFPGDTPIEITVLFPAGSSADVSAER